MISEGASMNTSTLIDKQKMRNALHDFDELLDGDIHVPYALKFAAEKHGLTVDQLKGHIEYQYELINRIELVGE